MSATTAQLTLDNPATFAAYTEAHKNQPAWLQRLKADAVERYLTLPMPHVKMESWRFSSVGRIQLGNFTPASLAGTNGDSTIPEDNAAEIRTAGNITFVNDGVQAYSPVSEALKSAGVIFLSLAEAIAQHPGLIQEHLFSRMPDLGSKKFEALHAALFTNGTFLYVPKGLKIEQPLIVTHIASGSGQAIFPHTLLVADEGSSVTLVDRFESANTTDANFICGLADIYAAPNSHVGYKAIQNWNVQSTAFHLAAASAERDAMLKTISVHGGGAHVRAEQHCRVLGSGAVVEMDSLAVSKGNQEIDQRTLQTHSAPNGKSNLLYKNVLLDDSRSIFSGLIRVDPVAQKTDAYQSNRNLLLSDTAEANSLPGLEIQANDVRCTHGATTSQIEPEQLFYLRARGLTERKAQELLTFGFCEEIIEKFENPEIAAYVRQLVQGKFAG